MVLSSDKHLRATKEGFAQGLLHAAMRNTSVVGLGTDITTSVGMNLFAEHFPERFFSLGIAEQNAVGIAAGMALMNKIPVFSTYAVFSALRCADQIRVSVCYNNLHVIIGGAHAGVSVGPDGATHQALEDIALMRSLPNMTVLSPCDATQTEKAVIAAVEEANSPVYIRYGRERMPDFTCPEQEFVIGKGQVLSSGNDVCIIATGHLTWQAFQAVKILEKDGIDAMLINIHTIKPLDEALIKEAAEMCGAIVCCEEHQIAGGLGSAVAELCSSFLPVPIEFIGIHDVFGESGTPEQLFKKFHLTSQDIVQSCYNVIRRKG